MSKSQKKETSKNKLFRDLQMLTKAIEGEGNERKFEISFSSEAPYERWYGTEILSHDDGAVDLTRLQEIGVVLFNHNRDYVIGKINKVWIEESRGCAEIEFDTDEEAEKIFGKVLSGTLKGVSVGYIIDCSEDVNAGAKSSNGKFDGPCCVATKWRPFEVSIVSVPADADVGVGRELEENESVSGVEEKSAHSLNIYQATVDYYNNYFS